VRNVDADEALRLILFRQDDVISRRQALRVMPEARLRQLVASGRWVRPCRGVFVAHNGPLTPTQRSWVAALCAGAGRPAPLAGISALVAHGLRGYDSYLVHVYLPANMRCTVADRPKYLIVHRTRQLSRVDLHSARAPRTTAARAALDAAQWASSDDQARALITAAFQQRLVVATDMRDALARLTRVSRRDLIAATVNDAAGGSESLAEHAFLSLCRRYGLPAPTRQAPVRDAAGRQRYRDAYFEPWRVHVEIDGGHHMEVREWWDDMRRQHQMWVEGDRVLRFPARAVRDEARTVAATVRAALVAAGWHP